MSLIQSARLNGRDRYADLKDAVKSLPTQHASDIAYCHTVHTLSEALYFSFCVLRICMEWTPVKAT
ncbi:hypothetical protein PS850_02622 [Pseudomonas fluorescens]|nr:hypothetical protein PS850_02622 [Pseudomonas fluorescens]